MPIIQYWSRAAVPFGLTITVQSWCVSCIGPTARSDPYGYAAVRRP